MGFSRRGLRVWVLVFVGLVVGVYVFFSLYMGVSLGVVASNPLPVAGYIVFFFASEAVRAERLRLVFEAVTGYRPSYARGFLARLAGDLVSSLTPSAIGGEVVRGAVAAGGRGVREYGVGVLVAVGLADGLYDLFTNTVLAAAMAPITGLGLEALLPLSLGAAASSSWVLGAYAASRGSVRRGVARLAGERFSAILGGAAEAFMEGFRGRVLAYSFLLSVLAWFLGGTGLYVVLSAYCGGPGVVESVALLLYTYLMGIIPLPAGLGAMDVWLAFAACPEGAVAWRTGTLLSLLVAGAVVGAVAAREVGEALRGGGGGG